MFKRKDKEKTNMLYPITGKPLWYTGQDMGVMDGDSFYSPDGKDKIIFARHPFCMDLFRQVDTKRSLATEKRVFRLNDDNSWTELKYVPNTNQLFPLDTPESDPEWIAAVKKGEESERKRIAQNKYWDEHPEEDPRIKAKLIGLDEVSVCPLGPPSGILLYMDLKYESKNK